ncbi:hypothetical protein BRADI_1g75975v3 [Brachypodium distachyon]|uniref:Uncharacterized protein n=1 Tax=Brachypodium distachyon TaxID=15368 RepID=A0A2K2DVE0_BRADI|nr:hypothetical protein BRADI_1g75975v3 [Brachypodium distachyon]
MQKKKTVQTVPEKWAGPYMYIYGSEGAVRYQNKTHSATTSAAPKPSLLSSVYPLLLRRLHFPLLPKMNSSGSEACRGSRSGLSGGSRSPPERGGTPHPHPLRDGTQAQGPPPKQLGGPRACLAGNPCPARGGRGANIRASTMRHSGREDVAESAISGSHSRAVSPSPSAVEEDEDAAYNKAVAESLKTADEEEQRRHTPPTSPPPSAGQRKKCNKD